MTTETTAQTLAEIEPGSVIGGRYTIEEEIGAGGFATVFSAFDREIERQVAIKVLNLAAMAGGQNTDVQPFLERFRREARLAARIRHGNVVEIYDFGVLGTQSNPYMVMEMLDGHDLQEEINDHGGMAPTRALPLFCGALDALGEAHQLGIVHKDLKPANLFINRPGTRHELLKVVDFGIAHIGESNESRMTQTGAMFGTPQYLPPEYIQTQVVTPGMDVYQMGLILVELLTGRSVVDEDNPWQCAVKHVTREIDIPVELLDGTLGPILRRALEYEPEDRYADAVQFADALNQIDPTSIGDVRSPSTLYRKIDNTSGQFVPAGIGESGAASQDTDAMATSGFGDTAALAPNLGNTKASAEQLQTRGASQDQTDSIEVWADEEKSSTKKLWLVLLLLLFLVVGAGVVVMQSDKGSTEPSEEGTSADETATAEPAGEPGADPTATNALAAEQGADSADDLLNANPMDENPEDLDSNKIGSLDSPDDVEVVDDKAPVERVVEKPKSEPAPVSNKPKDSKPSDTKPKAPKPKIVRKPPPPPKVEKPKPEPAAKEKEPKEEKNPPSNSGMMLAPDLDPDDMGMDLAP